VSDIDALKFPSLYLLSQGILGAKRARKKCIGDYARLKSGMRVLDIGCGPGYIVQYLPKVCYFGFDISPQYISYAKQKYGTQGTFFAQRFDADLLHLSNQAIRNTGRLITWDPCYRANQSSIARFLMNCDRGGSIRQSAEYVTLASKVFGDVQLHIREDLFFLPYTAAVMVCEAS